MKLSDRVRPGSEAAPWVIEEVKRLEAELEAKQAAPDGFRVMRPTSTILSEGDRWEIYAPCGSGGIVNEDDVTDWVVRKLLDALAAAPTTVQGVDQQQLEALGRDLRRILEAPIYAAPSAPATVQGVNAQLLEVLEDTATWIERLPVPTVGAAGQLVKIDKAIAAAQEGWKV